MNRYLEIFSELEKEILAGKFLPGDLLPSENQLAAKYQVSRETIRKALVLLLENGYIQKIQGKGSIVLDIRRLDFPISGLTSYKELQQSQHFQSETIVPYIEKKFLDGEEAVKVGLPLKQKIWKLVRQRKIDGEFIILDKDYLLASVIPELSKEVAEDSIYRYIEDELKLVISYAQKEIIVEPATLEDRQLMTLKKEDSHVVVVRSHVYLDNTQLFQYTESRHRMDKFRFVDFARRRKI